MGRILLLNMVLFIFPTYNPRICYRGIFKEKGKENQFIFLRNSDWKMEFQLKSREGWKIGIVVNY